MIVYCDFFNAEAESFFVNTLEKVEYVIILIHSTFHRIKVHVRLFLLARNFWLTNPVMFFLVFSLGRFFFIFRIFVNVCLQGWIVYY